MITIESPVADEFLRQCKAAPNVVFLDLTRLWEAAGRPSKMEPKRWNTEGVRSGCRDVIAATCEGDADDGHAYGDGKGAFAYAVELDDRLEDAYVEAMRHGAWSAPALVVLAQPHPITATVAIGIAIRKWGLVPSLAADTVVFDSVKQTSDYPAFQQETAVARVQRAISGESALFSSFPQLDQEID